MIELDITGCAVNHRWIMRYCHVVTVLVVLVIIELQVINKDVAPDSKVDTPVPDATAQVKQVPEAVTATEHGEPVKSSDQSQAAASVTVDQSEASFVTASDSSDQLSSQIEPSFTEAGETSLQEDTTATESIVAQSTLTDQSDGSSHSTDGVEPTQSTVIDSPSLVVKEEGSETGTPEVTKVKETPGFPQQPQGQHEVNATEKVLKSDGSNTEHVGDTNAREDLQSESPDAFNSQNEAGSDPSTDAGTRPVGVEAPQEDPRPEDLTFNEWTQKILAEAEKDKLEVDKEGKVVPVIPPAKQRKKKNFASYDCGAKILASNPEASNVKSVLNANKDDYMNTPCKVKKWFVFELCEPIQAHSVEISSLELFSSQPRKVKVMLSERYPTKDWRVAGEFEMTEERTLQTFPITGLQDYFVKYVRVELNSHFGDEHFCPLTIFRVLGVAVADYDDDEPPGHDDGDDDDDPDASEEDDGKSRNLFDTAKDTVLGIMKRVLNVESEPEQHSNGTAVNGTATTAGDSHNTNTESPASHMEPCIPSANIESDSRGGEQTFCTKSPGQPDTPLGGESSIVRILSDDEQEETNTSYLDQKEFTYMISTTSQTLHDQLNECGKKRDQFLQKTKTKSYNYSKLCHFMYILFRKSYACPVQSKVKDVIKDNESNGFHHHPVESSSVPSQSVIYMTGSSQSAQSAESSSTETVSKSSEILVTQSTENKNVEQPVSQKTHTNVDINTATSSTLSSSLHEQTKSTTIQPTKVADDIQQTGSPEISLGQTGSQISSKAKDQSKTLPSSETEEASASSIIIEPSSSSVSKKNTVTADEPRKTPDLPDDWNPNTRDITGQTKTAASEQEKDTETKIHPPTTVAQVDSSVTSSSVPSQVTEDMTLTPADQQRSSEVVAIETGELDDLMEDIAMETTTTTTEAPPSETSTTKPDTTISDDKLVGEGPAGGGGKGDRGGNLDLVRVQPGLKRESAIMRMSNRIKVLEQNVSLSSRFLEELSRRYKKQSEEMMKMLNKTMAKLSNMTVEVDVKNKLHEDEMGAMEQKLENLTAIVNRLTHSFEVLNQQVTDRQIIWTIIEVVVIFCVMVFLNLRWRADINLPPEVRSLIESMPSQPPALSSDLPKRRNSYSGPATPSKKMTEALQCGGGLQRFSSESMLAQPGHNESSAGHGKQTGLEGNGKKKKKKRNKGADMRLFTNSGGPFQGENMKIRETSLTETESETSLSSEKSQSTSSFGSLFSIWSKRMSNSLGTSEKEKPVLNLQKDCNVPKDFNGSTGTKFTNKNVSKKPPISSGPKVSPKLAAKVHKSNSDVCRTVNGHSLDEKLFTKGHRRQRSLPKQHFSSIETVGQVDRPPNIMSTAANIQPGAIGRSVKRSDLKKSVSLPSSVKGHSRTSSRDSLSSVCSAGTPVNRFPEIPVCELNGHSSNYYNTGAWNNLGKSKSDDHCSSRVQQNGHFYDGCDGVFISNSCENLPQTVPVSCAQTLGKGHSDSTEMEGVNRHWDDSQKDCNTTGLLKYGYSRLDADLCVNEDSNDNPTSSWKKMLEIFR